MLKKGKRTDESSIYSLLHQSMPPPSILSLSPGAPPSSSFTVSPSCTRRSLLIMSLFMAMMLVASTFDGFSTLIKMKNLAFSPRVSQGRPPWLGVGESRIEGKNNHVRVVIRVHHLQEEATRSLIWAMRGQEQPREKDKAENSTGPFTVDFALVATEEEGLSVVLRIAEGKHCSFPLSLGISHQSLCGNNFFCLICRLLVGPALAPRCFCGRHHRLFLRTGRRPFRTLSLQRAGSGTLSRRGRRRLYTDALSI